MTFRKGLLAVALFGLAMFGAVAHLTGSDAAPTPDPVTAAPAAPLPAPVAIAAPAAPPAAAAARQPRPLPVWADPAAQPTPRERAVAARLMPARTKFLLSRAIERAQPELRRCFPDASRIPVRQLAASRRALGQGALGTLVLRLQPDHGKYLVADVAIARKGSASDEELGCAADALRGLSLPFRGATPGIASTMMYPID
jgi:hypothetical protein